MKLVAVITNDEDVINILSSLRLSAEFPVLKPARPPPDVQNADSQVDPSVEALEGIDPPHSQD